MPYGDDFTDYSGQVGVRLYAGGQPLAPTQRAVLAGGFFQLNFSSIPAGPTEFDYYVDVDGDGKCDGSDPTWNDFYDLTDNGLVELRASNAKTPGLCAKF